MRAASGSTQMLYSAAGVTFPCRALPNLAIVSSAAARIEAMIQLVAQDDAAGTRTYRLSANVLPPNKRAQKPTPELEEETHEILGRTVEDLKGRTFQVRQIDPVRAEDGSIEYYDVSVKL